VRCLVSYFVAAVTALHALLGCCGHHAHAATDGAATVACETLDAVPCCGHHHAHGEHGNLDDHDVACHDDAAGDVADNDAFAGAMHDDEHPAPAPCSDSCEGKCQFVSMSRVQLDSPTTTHDLGLITAVPATTVDGSPLARFENRRSSVPPLPIRLHLWNRLLLI